MTFARFFVVGGAGFIGSHLVERLAERGPVTVFDDCSTGTRDNIAGVLEAGSAQLIQSSAYELDALTSAMQQHDVVFHLAEAAADPLGRSVERDVAMTANVLEAMRRTGARQIVFGSSGEVYGDTCEYCTEQHGASLPPSFYGAAKLASEAVITALSRAHGIQAWIFRMGEVVGPRARRGPLLDVMRACQGTINPMVVEDDPERARPFIFVDDCVEGILFAYDRATGPLEVFNLAPGDYTAMRRIGDMCRAVYGVRDRKIEWKHDESRSESTRQRRLNPSKLDALGWQTSRSSDEAVREALRIAQPEKADDRQTPSRFAEL